MNTIQISKRYANSPTRKKAYTIPEALLEDFEKAAPSGERSQLVASLIEKWLREKAWERLDALTDAEEKEISAEYETFLLAERLRPDEMPLPYDEE